MLLYIRHTNTIFFSFLLHNIGNNGMAALDSWGSNLSLVGSLETMRIDIVVSEYGKLPETGKKSKSFKNKSKAGIWLHSLDLYPYSKTII